jgi:tetratricopeptide (TPR) repeat protein
MRLIFIISILLGFTFSFVASASKIVKDDQKKIFVDDQIRFAAGLSDRQYYDAAINEYQRLIKKFPDDPITAEAYLRMAETYAVKNDYSKAFEIFNEFFVKFPKIRILTSAQLRYALVLYKSAQPDSIKKSLQILNKLKKSPDTSNVIRDAAIFHLGNIFKERGEVKKAEKEFALIAYKKINSEMDKYKAFAAMNLAEIKLFNDAVDLLTPLSNSLSLPNYILSAATWQLAELYRKEKQYSKAAELFARCTIIASDKETIVQALYKRLECIYLMKDYSTLIKEVDKQLTQKETLSKLMEERIRYLQALALRKNKFYKQALSVLNSIFSSTVDIDLKEKSLFAIVETFAMKNNTRAGVRLLEKLINSNSIPPNILTEPLLFIINDSKNNPEYLSMIDSLLKRKKLTLKYRNLLILKKSDLLVISGKFIDAEKLLSNLKDINDIDIKPFLLFKQANIFLNLNKNQLALQKYKTLCENFPKSELYTKALLQMGILLLDNKNTFSDAQDCFKKIFKNYKDSQEGKYALFYIAYIYFVQKKFNDAQQIYSHLLKSKIPDNLKNNTLLYLSWIYLKKKELPEAIKIIKNNTHIIDSAPEAFLFELAQATKNLDLDIAESALKTLLKNKNKENLQLTLIEYAEIKEKKGELKLAIKSLKQALEINKQDALTERARFNIARILSLQKKNQEAVLVFEKCLENPVDKDIAAKARLGLAKLLALDKDRLKTANRYAMAVFILSDNSEIASQAMLLSIKLSIQMKRKKEALSTFNELSSRFPKIASTPEVINLKKEIDSL